MTDNNRRNINLNLSGFIVIGISQRNSEFSNAAHTVKTAYLTGQRMDAMNELKMPDIPWFSVGGRIWRLREAE